MQAPISRDDRSFLASIQSPLRIYRVVKNSDDHDNSRLNPIEDAMAAMDEAADGFSEFWSCRTSERVGGED